MDLVLTRYGSFDYINKLPINEALLLVTRAIENKERDELYLLWVQLYRHMKEPVSFRDWQEKLTAVRHQDKRTTKEIMDEINELHKGATDGTI